MWQMSTNSTRPMDFTGNIYESTQKNLLFWELSLQNALPVHPKRQTISAEARDQLGSVAKASWGSITVFCDHFDEA